MTEFNKRIQGGEAMREDRDPAPQFDIDQHLPVFVPQPLQREK
jgi:hypothetical protein